MFEESGSFIPSIWASMNSWFTPTVLFVFLNLMIGTIAITSSLATKKGNNDQQKQQQQQQQQQDHYGHHHQQHQPQLARSPSMLQRLKSINFYNYRSHEPNTNFAQTNSVTNSHFTNHFSYEQEQEQQQEDPQPQHQSQYQQTPQLGRSPSMLQRLKSFNLYNYLSQDSADTHFSSNQEREREQEHHLEPEQDEEEQEEEGEGGEEEDRFPDQEQSLEDIYSQLRGKIAARTKSDTKPASGEILKKLPKKMKKSASSKSAFNHFKEEDIVEVEARRPATTKENGIPKMTQVDDEGVDAKADDFINNFRHQLKLQRTASILRYREMINRGAGK